MGAAAVHQFVRAIPVLLDALGQTLLLSLATFVCAGVAGAFLAEISRLPSRAFRWTLRRYVDVVRGIPLLVFLFLVYYVLPLFGLAPSNFASAVIALSLYFSGYVAEILRGAIGAIPSGQVQGAIALGMRRWKIELIVIVPQAARIALPPLLNLSSIIIKSTSLVSIIGIWELTYATREIVTRTLLPFEFFVTAMAIYFVVCYGIVRLSGVLERRLAKAYA